MSGANSGSTTKKRKKPDSKPQSQINKCLNEKRRREQENIYIEELAELISATFSTDMSSLSVKPDKCAILQETVAQIRHIKEQEASEAVQQGEVSSSKPTILTNEVFGPLLLEALEGFLFVVNPEGKVEFCTENVSQFIKYRKEELLGQSVYNILHLGDHARFSACLLPTSVGWVPTPPPSDPPSSDPPPPPLPSSKSKSFPCRFLVKPPSDGTIEEKQQRTTKYETMQISSTHLPQSGGCLDKEEDGGSEPGPCLMCVARRIPPNEKQLSMNSTLEQFTMKLETSGKIIGIDISGVAPTYYQHLSKWQEKMKGRSLEELCQAADVGKVSGHLKEALSCGQGASVSYRLRISPDKYLLVQTKSRLFKPSSRHEPDFIMATHSILGDSDMNMEIGSPADGGNTSHNPSTPSNNPQQQHQQQQQQHLQQQQQQQSSSSGVGGPLMASVNGANSRELSNTITLNNSSAFQSVTLNPDFDFGLDMFPSSSTWDLGEERGWERPESRQSLTPAQSPLYTTPAQPSPAPFQPPPFPFSPLQEAQEEPPEEDSGRLRNLLMTKRGSTESEDGGGATPRHKHRILNRLLNQEEDQQPPTPSPSPSQDSKPPSNNMLLRLLNTHSDDDDVEARAGLKKQNELLQQLLKDENHNQESGAGGGGGGEDSLLKSLGFKPGGGSPGGESRARKRPSSEESGGGGEEGGKRCVASLLDSVPPPPVSMASSVAASTGASKLWEKNRMLASLLAKRPTTPASIPPIPASVISATPQDKLPRIVKHSQPGWSGGSVQSGSGSGIPGSSPGSQSGSQQGGARSGRSPAYQSPANIWDSASSDPVLSDLLDQVIEIVPDVTTDSPALMNMINSLEAETQQSQQLQQQFVSQQELLNEKMAINAIQKSLMQCESAVKSPTYNTPISQGSPQQQFPPPPMYQQRQRFPMQQQQQQQIRQNPQQFTLSTPQQQQLFLAQRNKLQQQQLQQKKQLLLQMQQQQQLVIPSNAAATSSDPGIHNIDSLINNSVAPNVSLQRSSSVPDSQLSPVGSYPGLSSVPSPGQRRPFSPVNGGISSFQGGGGGGPPVSAGQQARLSPSSLQGYQQAQLSPRLTQGQQSYGGGGGGTSWSQQSARLSLQQQDNAVLNAQLATGRSYVGRTAGGGGGGGLPSVRSLTATQRFSSPELSPGGQPTYQGFRLQRQVSAPPQASPQPQSQPSPASQLPGSRVGVGYGSPPLCHHPGPGPPVYSDQQYCYPDPAYPPRIHHHPHHGGNNGVTEYVRNELRTLVQDRRTQGRSIPPGTLPLASVDLETLNFDIQPQGVGDSPKMWGSMSEMGAGSPQPNQQLSSRSAMEEVSRSTEQSKSSLLQKLLSE